MKLLTFPLLAGAITLLGGCVSPEEQRAMDQQQCSGYGFSPGSDAFANCMMKTTQQRDAQAAADRRAAADRDAADRRAREAKDQADRDAWDKQTGQGKYANTPSSSSSPSSPSMPDLSGMNCTSTSSSSGSPNNMTTTTNTSCHN
jgi:hypothetical protein